MKKIGQRLFKLTATFLKIKNMKYVALVLLFGWSAYLLYAMPYLKPSDNFFLWTLGVLSFLYTVINLILLLSGNNRKQTPIAEDL